MQKDNSREMDTLWGEGVIALRAENAERGQLFNDGNYAMFIHWGPYAQLANKVDGKTYYGIGEWIMNPRMANSWAFAWYDEYWKTPGEILRRLISCVAVPYLHRQQSADRAKALRRRQGCVD